MRITHEADYAVRIVYDLMKSGGTVSARTLAERTGVTLRFTLKILNKLSAGGIVSSVKGASGGYRLEMSPQELSLGHIIECSDGPFELHHCLSSDFDCTRVGDKNICAFHHIFNDMTRRLKEEFYSIKMSRFMQNK
jgi:Rrf2 family protein